MSSVRLSVRQSVTLVIFDHIGWKSWKLIARTLSPTPSLFVAKKRSTYSHLLPGEIWGRIEVGYREKVAFWRTKAAISLKRVKIEEKLLWTTYIGTHQRSFERYHPRPSTASSCVSIAMDRPNFCVRFINSRTDKASNLAVTFI